MKNIFCLVLFLSQVSIFAQKEVNLGIDESVGTKPYLLSVTSVENKIIVKYLCIPECQVKSDDESTINGNVVTANSLGIIKGGVPLSDAVVIVVSQVIDPSANTVSVTQTDMIALRNVDPSKKYLIGLENVDNKCKFLSERKEVLYNRSNYNTIKNLSSNELKFIEQVLKAFEGLPSARNYSPIDTKNTLAASGGTNDEFSNNNFNYKFPEGEKILKFGFLDNGIDYITTRDKSVKKETGEAYKTYFVFPGKQVVKYDSAFYADRSDNESPERVFNIDKNKYTGILTRLSCEPLQSDIKLKYFRYSYIDSDKTIKRIRFQTENGKMNSFQPERTFRIGDTIIHVTNRKSSYKSSVFFNDTVQTRFPSTDQDTLKFKFMYCENLPAGPRDIYGFNHKVFMNEKQDDMILIGEQGTMSKSSAGLAQIGTPEAEIMGYAITKLYIIKANSVRSIYKISVPYFSKFVSTYSVISKDKGVYLINLNSPVFLIVDKKGNVSLKDAAKPGYVLEANPFTRQSIFSMNGDTYGLFKDAKGKFILIAFGF